MVRVNQNEHFEGHALDMKSKIKELKLLLLIRNVYISKTQIHSLYGFAAMLRFAAKKNVP